VKTQIVPFFISHGGCPHRCVFCDQERISGRDGSLPSSGEIRARISDYRRTSGRAAVEVAFYGGSFTGLSREGQLRLLAPLQPLIAAGEVCSVRVSTRPDTMDDEVAAFLRDMGVGTVELGVQSMDDGVLEMSGRGHCAADTEKAAASLKRQGLAAGLQLMPGLPGDTFRKSRASLDRALGLEPDFLRIYPTVVISGTPLARMYQEGSYRPLSMQAAVALCKVMLHDALRSGVPVIRMGLQPTLDLEREGTVLAGPYHPAFRHLVESELWYDLIDRLLPAVVPAGSAVTISCAPSRVSSVIGDRRMNIVRLGREKGVRVTRVAGDPGLSPLDVEVAGPGGVRRGNIVHNLSFSAEE
jgi:histone acetyltransferase (RNA polymerase elongator complex component)